jgi:hypothetical protein
MKWTSSLLPLPCRLHLDGHLDSHFTYIPVHIEFILAELVKNSMAYACMPRRCPCRCQAARVARAVPNNVFWTRIRTILWGYVDFTLLSMVQGIGAHSRAAVSHHAMHMTPSQGHGQDACRQQAPAPHPHHDLQGRPERGHPHLRPRHASPAQVTSPLAASARCNAFSSLTSSINIL